MKHIIKDKEKEMCLMGERFDDNNEYEIQSNNNQTTDENEVSGEVNNDYSNNGYNNNGYNNNDYNNNGYNNNGYNNNGYNNNGYNNNGYNNNMNNMNNMNRPPKKNNFAKFAAVVAIICAIVGMLSVVGYVFQGLLNYAVVNNSDSELAWDDNENKGNKENKENKDNSKEELKTTEPVKVTEAGGSTTGVTDVSGIVEASMPSVVSITSTSSMKGYSIFGQQYEQEVSSAGTGFIVGKNDDEILLATNNHVVEDATGIQVTFSDETTAQAVVKGTNADSDLAVVSVKLSDIKEETLSVIKVAVLGNSDEVKVGQIAIAIGNAQGMGQSVTVGYISAKERELDMGNAQTGSKKMKFLQTDAAINGGNSGGPLLDIGGNVVGINSAKISDTQVEGMCYAIPISQAIPIINELMNRETLTQEEKGYMGVSLQDISSEAKEMYGVPDGVYVAEVSANGPADKAGILKGDIITEIDGVAVTSVSAAVDKISSNRIGTELTVTLYRQKGDKTGYDKTSTKVTLVSAEELGINLNSNSSNGGQKDGDRGYDREEEYDEYDDYDDYDNNEIDDWFNDMFPW